MAKYGSRNQTDCGLSHEIRKFQYFRKKFYQILSDTQKALKDVSELNLIPSERTIVESITKKQICAQRPAVIVVLGPARGRLVNYLLGEKLLPPQSNVSSKLSGWRWLRLQHGAQRQTRLIFGTDFEILEPNLTSDSDLDRIPTQNLRRSNKLDLSTIMEIELCNPFLENGVQILIPPDIGNLAFDRKSSYDSFLNEYESFYSKREKFLENIFPLILYAVDEIDPLIANVDVKTKNDRPNMTNDLNDLNHTRNSYSSKSKSKTNSSKFYVDIDSNNSINSLSSNDSIGIQFEANENITNVKNMKQETCKNCSNHIQSGLSEDNILDLQQVYELHPNTEVLIVFLNNVINEHDYSNDAKSPSIIDTMNFETRPSPHLFSSNSPEIFSMSPDIAQNNFSNQSSYSSCNSNFLNENRPSSSTSSKSPENLFKKERREQLEIQKDFLETLIEQLKTIKNPIMGQSLISHWLIVNDGNIRNNCSMHETKNIKSSMASEFNVVIDKNEFSKKLTAFARNCLQKYMLRDCADLSEMHNTLLEQFILASFDMAREMQIIPRRINYAAEMEQKLYESFNRKLTDDENREKLLVIINNVLQEMKCVIRNSSLLGIDSHCLSSYDPTYSGTGNSVFYTDIRVETPVNVEVVDTSLNDSSVYFDVPVMESISMNEIGCDMSEYCVIDVPPNNSHLITEGIEAAEIPSTSRNCLDRSDSVFLENDETLDYSIFDIICNSQESRIVNQQRVSQTTFKQASLDVQRTVLASLSRNISVGLVKFMNYLRDDYYGTLQRCLASLEAGRDEPLASEAVKQIILVTRNVDLQNCASFSLFHTIVDQLRRFFNGLSLSSQSNESSNVHNPEWRQQVALNTIESLNASKLAKLITSQLRDKIRLSHEKFQSALHSLNEYHLAQLHHTEDMKLVLRKIHAPRFARLCLESTSLGDSAKFGVPRLGKELGRGQYGVVYSTRGQWGNHDPCAVKSVVPPDERHFNELAMEFYHTRSLPPHDRIANLYGSVIDYSYGNGNPAVLLISERLKWDLQCALQQARLTFVQRMQIAVDIVEGIRYLHSRGLVHRDIKLKNVLLDESHRAKLTDLGFCIPEAMMSGSVVGTPIHMAPELLMGIYDSSVDVYAFGILFWYVCAGDIHLPSAFEIFKNTDQLWTNVKKGLRPERLGHFSDICWKLMEGCWAAEPTHRPLLGDVEPLLKQIRDNPNLHSRRQF